MPQTYPLIVMTSGKADRVNDLFDRFASDGVIAADEVRVLDAEINEMDELSDRAEAAYQWGMAVLKGGIDGKRARELEIEALTLASMHAFEPLDAA